MKAYTAQTCNCGYDFTGPPPFQTRLEVHFYQQDEGCVYYESTAPGNYEAFAELVTFCSLAVRQLVNLGLKSEPAQGLAHILSVVDEESVTLLPYINQSEELPKLVDYKGTEGRKRFVLNVKHDGTKLIFDMSAKGFGLLARGVGWYAPNSVLLFLRHLATKHQKNKAYLSKLAVATAACGQAYFSGHLSMASQLFVALACATMAHTLPEERESAEDGLESCIAAAHGGDPEAQAALGQYYDTNGQYDEAIKWYQKAAAQGYPQGQRLMGDVYRDAVGVQRDLVKAHEWYLKAANQGDCWAQVNLGVMYLQGEGVNKDPKMAVQWFNKAAEAGEPAAQNALGKMYKNGDGVAVDRVKAVEFFRQAAELGYPYAQYNLGLCYEEGDVLVPNIEQAKYWYLEAAQQGLEEAIDRLKMLH